ncbi:MAG: GGDEF domain-containing protein [Longimicrobiales bacterium]
MSSAEFQRPPLVLVANRQEWSARSVESVLGSHGYAVLRAYTAAQAVEYARSSPPDIAVIDVELGDMSGYQLSHSLRTERLITAATPIVMTTDGAPTETELLRALESGAWDLLGLPLKYDVLLLKLGAFARAKLTADHAREEGLIDALTGFYNTRGMLRRAKEIVLDAARHGLPVACVAFSAEPEDAASAAEGEEAAHVVPPELMDRITQAFKAAVRASDAVGRLGEGEFVILAPHTTPDGARRMAERIARSATTTVQTTSRMEVRVRAGCYGVDDSRKSPIDPVELLMRATRALRRSQADLGGERIQFYTDAQNFDEGAR